MNEFDNTYELKSLLGAYVRIVLFITFLYFLFLDLVLTGGQSLLQLRRKMKIGRKRRRIRMRKREQRTLSASLPHRPQESVMSTSQPRWTTTTPVTRAGGPFSTALRSSSTLSRSTMGAATNWPRRLGGRVTTKLYINLYNDNNKSLFSLQPWIIQHYKMANRLR